jgi:hypothetical protein
MLQWKSKKYYILRVCVFVALGNQHAMQCNAHAPYCLLRPARLYSIFFTLSHKRHELRIKVIENKMCFDFLYNFCLEYFSFQEEMTDMIKNVLWSSCKVPVTFVRFNET